MRYVPTPINTSDVIPTGAISELIEQLAEHVHNVWAQQRLAQGWSYGPERNDVSREHPCLVPYDALPETEKEYDRCTALESIKAILALGYGICPPQAADRLGAGPPRSVAGVRLDQTEQPGSSHAHPSEIEPHETYPCKRTRWMTPNPCALSARRKEAR